MGDEGWFSAYGTKGTHRGIDASGEEYFGAEL
jgi:hypothetical protein